MMSNGFSLLLSLGIMLGLLLRFFVWVLLLSMSWFKKDRVCFVKKRVWFLSFFLGRFSSALFIHPRISHQVGGIDGIELFVGSGIGGRLVLLLSDFFLVLYRAKRTRLHSLSLSRIVVCRLTGTVLAES